MSTTTISIRHPGYAEGYHSEFLNTLAYQVQLGLNTAPYSTSTARDIEACFFGTGYLISSYTSLQDMFGKFLAGFDLEVLWRDCTSSAFTPSNINDYTKEVAVKLDETIDTVTLPNFKRNMRELNAVLSSSFIVGCANIESKRVKDYAAINLEAVVSFIPTALDKFNAELAFGKRMFTEYAQVMKAYFVARMDTDLKGYTLRAEDVLWPFTILDYQRRALNSLGPQYLEEEIDKQTWAEQNKQLLGGVSIVLWTVQGAYIGSAYPPYGTIIGAIVGFVIGMALYFLQ